MTAWRPAPIPPHTDRMHLKPYWYGDSPRAIKKAGRSGRRRRGSPYIDLNLQKALDGAVGLHWGTARKNGYVFIAIGKGRRRMTEAELDRPVAEWHTRDIVRWRRTRRKGLLYRSVVHPCRYTALLHLCRAADAVPCFELKSPTFDSRAFAQVLVRLANNAEVTAYFMTLVVMANWRGKMRAFHEAGAQTALLAHGAPRPHDLADQMQYVDQIWGRFR